MARIHIWITNVGRAQDTHHHKRHSIAISFQPPFAFFAHATDCCCAAAVIVIVVVGVVSGRCGVFVVPVAI